jgi:hypothetical protein
MKSEGSNFTMYAAAACLFTLSLAGCKLQHNSNHAGESPPSPPGTGRWMSFPG